jgi:hypothetical protein
MRATKIPFVIANLRPPREAVERAPFRNSSGIDRHPTLIPYRHARQIAQADGLIP